MRVHTAIYRSGSSSLVNPDCFYCMHGSRKKGNGIETLEHFVWICTGFSIEPEVATGALKSHDVDSLIKLLNHSACSLHAACTSLRTFLIWKMD